MCVFDVFCDDTREVRRPGFDQLAVAEVGVAGEIDEGAEDFAIESVEAGDPEFGVDGAFGAEDLRVFGEVVEVS